MESESCKKIASQSGINFTKPITQEIKIQIGSGLALAIAENIAIVHGSEQRVKPEPEENFGRNLSLQDKI